MHLNGLWNTSQAMQQCESQKLMEDIKIND